MKNLFISALVMGALACPVVYANENDAADESNVNQMQEENAKMDSHKSKGKKKKHGKKKNHHKNHHKKHHANKHAHKNQPKKMAEEDETPAEKKIDEETELTNR